MHSSHQIFNQIESRCLSTCVSGFGLFPFENIHTNGSKIGLLKQRWLYCEDQTTEPTPAIANLIKETFAYPWGDAHKEGRVSYHATPRMLTGNVEGTRTVMKCDANRNFSCLSGRAPLVEKFKVPEYAIDVTNVSLKMTVTHASSPGIRVVPLTFLIHMNIFRNQTDSLR